MSESWTSQMITHLLRERHAPPQWAFFAELSSQTGGLVRAFDAWAMNVWPSGGFQGVGYEIKISRGDFARELADPTKRQPMERVSNECYFAAPAGLLRVDEIPEGWGLIEATNGEEPKLRVKKHATQRKIEALPLRFVASLARRSADPEVTVPVAAWRLAGRMLTLADLDRLIAARRDQTDRAMRLDTWRDAEIARMTVHAQELRAYQALLADKFGHRVAYHLPALRAALSGDVRLGGDLLERLRRLGHDIGAIVEAAQ